MPVTNRMPVYPKIDVRNEHMSFMLLYSIKNKYGPKAKAILVTSRQFDQIRNDKYMYSWLTLRSNLGDIVEGFVGVVDGVVMKKRIKLQIWMEIK